MPEISFSIVVSLKAAKYHRGSQRTRGVTQRKTKQNHRHPSRAQREQGSHWVM